MCKQTSILFFLLVTLCIKAQVIGLDIDTSPTIKFETGKDVLSAMHGKYKNGPCKSYTFSQKNTHYKNDSIIGNSEWHEYVDLPDKFRIDFGKTEEGNFIIYKNDSSYRYKNHLLKKTSYDLNILLLLLGGMYYRELPDVIERLEKEHYNTQIMSVQKWNKQNTFVIGAPKGDTSSNQIWVDKKSLRVIRIIEKMDSESTMDMTFDSFQKNCKGYTETKVTFRRNGKIEQVEEYYNIKTLDEITEDVFNPR